MKEEEWFHQQADDAGQLTQLAKRAQETFWGLLGCEIVQADARKATICLDLLKAHQNLLGIAHGGVLMSLMDNAMGLVVMLAESNERTVTATMNTHFVASASSGLLLCEAVMAHRTRRTLTLQAEVRDEDGNLLALGNGSYRLI